MRRSLTSGEEEIVLPDFKNIFFFPAKMLKYWSGFTFPFPVINAMVSILVDGKEIFIVN